MVTLMMMMFFQKLKLHNLMEKEPSDRDGWAWMRACVRAGRSSFPVLYFFLPFFLSFSSFFPCC